MNDEEITLTDSVEVGWSETQVNLCRDLRFWMQGVAPPIRLRFLVMFTLFLEPQRGLGDPHLSPYRSQSLTTLFPSHWWRELVAITGWWR